MVFYHSPTYPAPLLPTFFQGPPGGTKTKQKCIKTHVVPRVCAPVASKWPLGGSRDAKVLHTTTKGAQKCPFGAPRVAQTLQKWCFTMGKHSFLQNQQIHTFPHFWRHLCCRGAPKWRKRWPGGGRGRARGSHLDPKGAKKCSKR